MVNICKGLQGCDYCEILTGAKCGDDVRQSVKECTKF